MRHLLILGGGTAGTMMANKLAPVLDEQEWQITLVDGSEQHYYQSGFLFVPFGTYRLRDIVKPRRQYLPSGSRSLSRLSTTLTRTRRPPLLAIRRFLNTLSHHRHWR